MSFHDVVLYTVHVGIKYVISWCSFIYSTCRY